MAYSNGLECIGYGHSRFEIGIASLRSDAPALRLASFSDTASYVKLVTKLKIIQPTEVLSLGKCLSNDIIIYDN